MPDTPQQRPDWEALAQSREFRELLAAKAAFLIPICAFFVIYYFALPYLVGYWPEAMKKYVWGKVNVAYLFALSQFFMAWAVAFVYLRKAAEWDRKAAQIIRHQPNH